MRRFVVALVLPVCVLATGCAAMTNPVADGVRVKHLPQGLLARPKSDEQTIPLTLLRQPPVPVYRLGAGDVLGVYAEGVLGDKNQPPPLHVSMIPQIPQQRRLPPAVGYPFPVQPDGTVALPQLPPVPVQGLTLPEAREAVRKAYLDKGILREESNVFVTLLSPRLYQVVVMRQEATGFSTLSDGQQPINKRNTGAVVELAAGENDVLHALAQTGGLPGLDAYNEILIQRDAFRDGQGFDALQHWQGRPGGNPAKLTGVAGEVVRIPLRLPTGAPLPVRPEDVVLHTGDVVFLEARDCEVFYTGGLMPPGMHVLPRDRDLDVVEALAWVRGPLINGAFGGSNLAGNLVQPGLGAPSPSLLAVVRRTPGGGQVVIRVDLRRALHDARERLLVRPGDVLILQETPGEALTRYVTQTFLNFDILWSVFRTSRAVGVFDVSSPDRLPSRLGFVNVPQ
jgi:protein involved in polysaccharide export with SLBB domain